MKTEELEAIGLSKEQIQKVFELNGKDVNKFKKTESENQRLKEDNAALTKRAETAEETLKGFEGKDYESMSKELEEWKDKYKNDTEEYQRQIHDRDYNDAIQEHISGLQFTSESAKKAYIADLKAAELSMKDGKVYGLTDFLASYKESDSNAFVKEEKKPTTPEVTLTKPLGDDSKRTENKQNLRRMSYKEIVKLKQDNPEQYKQLKEGE